MVCRECGNRIPDDSVTCPNCGSELLRENDPVRPETDVAPQNAGYIRAFDAAEKDGAASASGSARKTAAAIISVIAAAAVLILCYYSLPKSRYKRIMRRAVEHLSVQEIVLAAEDYRKALKLVPESADAREALYGIWSSVLNEVTSLADSSRFEEALTKARMLAQIDPDRITMNRSAVSVIYKQWVRVLAEKDDSEGIEKLLSDAQGDLTDEEIGDIRQEASRARIYFRIVDRLNEEAETIISLSDEGAVSEAFRHIALLSELTDQYMDLGGNAPFVFGRQGSDRMLGFFFSGYDVSAVIGKLDQTGIADGQAAVYYAERFGTENQYLYWYSCEWKNGRPDGYCEYSESGGDASDETGYITMKGMLSEGDWDGEVEERYTDGETYTISFSKGRIEVLSREDADRNVVGYNKDGDKKRYYSDQAVDREYGVPYMYYN